LLSRVSPSRCCFSPPSRRRAIPLYCRAVCHFFRRRRRALFSAFAEVPFADEALLPRYWRFADALARCFTRRFAPILPPHEPLLLIRYCLFAMLTPLRMPHMLAMSAMLR